MTNKVTFSAAAAWLLGAGLYSAAANAQPAACESDSSTGWTLPTRSRKPRDSELEGKHLDAMPGPMTFGEIAYQLLNQTLVYLAIEKH